MAYRDKKTGRFVAASTWRRSKAQGGSRYVRAGAVKRKPLKRGTVSGRKVPPITRPQAARPKLNREYLVTMDYKARKRGSVTVDIEVIADDGLNRNQVIKFMKANFKKNDQWLLRFADSFFSVIQGKLTSQQQGVTVINIERPR